MTNVTAPTPAIGEDGLTQAEFARRVGASTEHVNAVLGGRAFAYPATLDFWAFPGAVAGGDGLAWQTIG